jgi:hypothetical protein
MLDPLLPDVPRRRVRRPDPAGHLCAVALVLVAFAVVIALGEGLARQFDGPTVPHAVTAAAGVIPDSSTASTSPRPTDVRDSALEDSIVAPPEALDDPRPESLPSSAPPACNWLRPLLRTHGVPSWMIAVAWRESRCTSDAVNRNHRTGDASYGVFQINTLGSLWGEVQRRCAVSARTDLLDASRNVYCAAQLYTAYGYRPWDPSR